MNKDKEWAKIKIHEELDSWRNIEGGIDGDGIKYVLNIIDQIDEPEIDDISGGGRGMNAIEPEHYNKGEIDLFEAAYRTRPFNEVRAIMEFIAERYFKRDKNNRLEDIDKGIYVMQRLREYEEKEAVK